MTRTAGPEMASLLDEFSDTIKAGNFDSANQTLDIINRACPQRRFPIRPALPH
ncbi:MAG: hypothetical protein HC898_09565 [Phycisphaerales bacterium]|nr:hypothetical protein [Phycisphaerales bacterium]